MTLQEAIEILADFTKSTTCWPTSDLRDAIKLSTEALERVIAYKEAHRGLPYEPMPGETGDEDDSP